MDTLPYYIYLDSKIVGTAKQIAAFFEEGIFSSDTTVLIKKYKHKSAKQIAAIFKHYSIAYRFVSASDLDVLPKGIIFYPFNAQSNCRAVANRKLTHIFITHGESNKIASVKPIIRIYDYVLTAGQAGIDRFLVSGIFTQHDVDSGRIIVAGNTFIGQTGLSPNGKKCILYAPTWEGGIEQENYSSLAYWQDVAGYIIQKSLKYQTDTVLIRPHPNTGYRIKQYQNYLFELIKLCRQQNLNVVVYQINLALSKWQQWKWKKYNVQFSGSLKDFQAVFGLCDISAMETQFLNEDIIYELFVDTEKFDAIVNNKDSRYIKEKEYINKFAFFRLQNQQAYKEYVINTSSRIANSQKIESLLTKIMGQIII